MQIRKERLPIQAGPLKKRFNIITAGAGGHIFLTKTQTVEDKNSKSAPDPHFPDRLSGMGKRQQNLSIPGRTGSARQTFQRPGFRSAPLYVTAFIRASDPVVYLVSKRTRQIAYVYRFGMRRHFVVAHVRNRPDKPEFQNFNFDAAVLINGDIRNNTFSKKQKTNFA